MLDGKRKTSLDALKDQLIYKFSMKDLGNVERILNMQTDNNRKDKHG